MKIFGMDPKRIFAVKAWGKSRKFRQAPRNARKNLHDITERKQVEEELRKERDFAESLVNTAQTIVLVLDREGRIVRFNPYMEDISGYSLDEVRGKDWFTTFLPEENHAEMRELFIKAVGDIQTRGNVNTIITKDGSKREIEWYDKTLKDADGNITGILTVGQDITDRKQAEAKIARLATVVEQAAVTIVITDLEGNIVYTNPDFEISTGYNAAEVLGQNPRILQSDYQDAAFYRELWDTVTTGRTWSGVFVNKRKDGNFYHEQATIFPVKDATGEIINYAGVKRDITERVRAEEQLISQARFTSENPNPVMRISGDGEILHANRAAKLLLENMAGSQNPRLPESLKELVDKSLASGKSQNVEYQCGEKVCFLTLAPIVDSGYVNVYAHDITKRKNVEWKLLEHQKKLRSLARQLAKAEERQRRRIASGLHDNVVQNLAAIKISAAMLRDSTKVDETRNEIEGIIRILDDTIYETRTLTFELCPPILHNLGFDPAAEWLVEEFGKHNKISTEFKSLMGASPCNMPEDLRDLMFQLLREILTNVAKHAEASNIKVFTSSGDGKYIASVEDNGKGFDVSSVMSKSETMEGFGLFNIRERLGHFDGKLDIDSKQGKGTKITISLPNQNDGDTT